MDLLRHCDHFLHGPRHLARRPGLRSSRMRPLGVHFVYCGGRGVGVRQFLDQTLPPSVPRCSLSGAERVVRRLPTTAQGGHLLPTGRYAHNRCRRRRLRGMPETGCGAPTVHRRGWVGVVHSRFAQGVPSKRLSLRGPCVTIVKTQAAIHGCFHSWSPRFSMSPS